MSYYAGVQQTDKYGNPLGASNTVGNATQTLVRSGDAANRWRSVTQRTRHQCFPAYAGVAASINPRAGMIPRQTGRWWHTLSTRAPLARIRIRYANVGAGANGNTEADGLTQITLTSSVEFNTTTAGPFAVGATGAALVRVTFNGQTSVTLPAGPGIIESDDIIIPFSQLAGFYTRTFIQSAGTAGNGTYFIPIGYETNTGFFEGVNYGDNLVTFINGNGSTATYSGIPAGEGATYPFGVSLNGTAIGVAGANVTITDQGDGTFPVSGNIAAGSTVNYTTGALSINFVTAPAARADRHPLLHVLLRLWPGGNCRHARAECDGEK